MMQSFLQFYNDGVFVTGYFNGMGDEVIISANDNFKIYVDHNQTESFNWLNQSISIILLITVIIPLNDDKSQCSIYLWLKCTKRQSCVLQIHHNPNYAGFLLHKIIIYDDDFHSRIIFVEHCLAGDDMKYRKTIVERWCVWLSSSIMWCLCNRILPW